MIFEGVFSQITEGSNGRRGQQEREREREREERTIMLDNS